jgi:hypothetical protein
MRCMPAYDLLSLQLPKEPKACPDEPNPLRVTPPDRPSDEPVVED